MGIVRAIASYLCFLDDIQLRTLEFVDRKKVLWLFKKSNNSKTMETTKEEMIMLLRKLQDLQMWLYSIDSVVKLDIYTSPQDDGLGDGVDSPKMRQYWELRKDGDSNFANVNEREFGKSGMFNIKYVYPDKVCPTLAARKSCLIRFDIPKYLSATEVCCISSFPQDYNFCGQQPHYICGMSVPPVMMANVASNIFEQWLSKL